MREISVVGKLVLGPAPRGEFLADGSGDAGVVGEGPEHAEGVVAVQLGEAGALGVGSGGVVGIGADEVEVVSVGLPIGHRGERDDFLQRSVGLELQAADEGLVPERIISGGLGEREPVGGVVGKGDAVAVGLAAVVLVAGFAPEGAVDERQEAGGGIAGADPRIDGALAGADDAGGADAVHGFAESSVALATDKMADPGAGHEIALVRGIDEGETGVALAGGGEQCDDPSVFQLNGIGGFGEQASADDGDPGALKHVGEDFFRDPGFVDPLHVQRVVLAGVGAFFRAFEKVGAIVAAPRRGLQIVIVDVTVKFPRDAADDGAAIHVGRGQPGGRDAAEVGGLREEHD